MTSTADLVPILGRAKIVPVVRARSAEGATQIVQSLVGAGIDVVELTTTIPAWREVLRQTRSGHPDVVVGVGTVLDADAAEIACIDGAHFLVTPFPAPAAREVARANGTAVIGGGLTPAEIHQASSEGVAKLFPAHLGGPAYLRSLKAVLPDAHVVPTGGVTVDAVSEWLAAGALAVGIGSDLHRSPDLSRTVDELRRSVQDVPA